MGMCETETQAQKRLLNQAVLKSEDENRIPEIIFNDHKRVPSNIIKRTLKSICKIIIKTNGKDIEGTGFFMRVNDKKKYLITNYHIISKDNIKYNIYLELYYNKRIKLNIYNRDIKFFEKPKDITMIEITNEDERYNDIEFLDYEKNYTKGYKIYKDVYIFSIGHPFGNDTSYSTGQITNFNNYGFEHNIPTTIGSSGCPIILLNDNVKRIKVIGIHTEGDGTKKINYGTFIGEIFNNNIYPKNINNRILNLNIIDFYHPTIICIGVALRQDNSNIYKNIEGNEFINQLKYDSNSIFEFKDNNMAMDMIKQLKFQETIIIVNIEQFVEFVTLFNQNLLNICIIPQIIIYSENKIDIKFSTNIPNIIFYTQFGVRNRYQIINYLNEKAKEKENINMEYPKSNFDAEMPLIFERIKNRGDLYLPSFYKLLLDISKTDNYRFIELMKIYKNDAKYKELFNTIIYMPNIPIELLSKYYVRMFTIDGNFFDKMKIDLLIDYNKDNIIYQSYIKTLYEGVERKALKPLNTFQGIQLFSAQYFTENQIKELNEYRLSPVDYYNVPIIFSKSFLSFTKDIMIAEDFMNVHKKNIMLTIVEADSNYDLNTYADIEELSCFPEKKEVLFFPFSSFGIVDFKYDDEKGRYNMKLIYLGKLIKNCELREKFEIERDELPEPYFKVLFKKSGLIDEGIIDKIKVR